MALQPYLNSRSPLPFPSLPFPTQLTLPRLLLQTDKILVLTSDGRTLVGHLAAFDTNTNLILEHTIERIIRPADDPEPSSVTEHGLYVVRGDAVACCGLVDEELDASIDWERVRGEVIGGTKHV